jgi:N,N'-diacetylchitobiose transport system substrate-binding protein
VKRRLLVAASAVAALVTVAGCGSSGSKGSASSSAVFSTNGKGKTLTVWLQAPPVQSAINQTNAEFTKLTGAKVVVDAQQWVNYTNKLTATFSGNTGIPDVAEIGNTDAPTYVGGGALMNITSAKSQFANSSTWLAGLEKPCEDTSGNLYCVPYYGGDRVMIYRTDMFQKAGITSPPTSMADLQSDCGKLEKAYASDPHFSCLYMPGQYWVAGGSFVYGAGGSFAKFSNGKWQGNLESAASQKGLQAWATFAKQYSRGATTTNELNQDQVMAQGHVAMIMGSTWEEAAVSGPTSKQGNPALAKDLSTFPVPGYTPGTYLSAFMGGSILAVPQKAKNKGLAMEWLKILDSNQIQQTIATAAIPNTNALLSTYAKAGQAEQSAVTALNNGNWATPATENWAKVEGANIPALFFEKIATGTSTMAAAKWADQQINKQLNGD